METSLRRGGIDVPEPVRRFLQGETEGWLRVEEHRDRNSLVVRTDLPGIDPDTDIDINASEAALQITARGAEPASKDQPGYRTEVRYGEFSRSIPTPRGANPDAVEVSYIDGVLGIRVRLPENSGKPAATVHVSRGGNQLPDAPENYLT